MKPFSTELRVALDILNERVPEAAKEVEAALVAFTLLKLFGSSLRYDNGSGWGPDFGSLRMELLREAFFPIHVGYHPLHAVITGGESVDEQLKAVRAWLRGTP